MCTTNTKSMTFHALFLSEKIDICIMLSLKAGFSYKKGIDIQVNYDYSSCLESQEMILQSTIWR